MRCNCMITDMILSAVIVVFAFWNASFSPWVIVVAALGIFIHSILHRGLYSNQVIKAKLKRR